MQDTSKSDIPMAPMAEQPDSATAQTVSDEEMIDAAFARLISTYLASNHRKKTDIITRAFHFAKRAHAGVRRRSGEPYILHPIAVAQIVCEEIGLGSTSICAALLHDVVEDTDFTADDIARNFNPKIAEIVEGLTKISGGAFGEKVSAQAETFKKLLLTMSEDVRVILVKMADRLHNMRTLSSMLPSKQYKIAGETLYIYAPLADRLGLNKIKSELENLSFKYEHPEEYARITELISTTQAEHEKTIADFVPPIEAMLQRMGYEYTIINRIKTPYSIWHKMQTKHVAFEEIYDILAIRIVFKPHHRDDEITEAHSIYGALSQIYRSHPQRYRNWLSQTKPNGYQAIHDTFMSHQGKWVEVQIRSDRMDDIAEKGFAAHWKYKDAGATAAESQFDSWLNSVKEILNDPQPNSIDLLDTIKQDLSPTEILVFTPKGEVRTLPSGATALDFAFSIHTMVGTHCFAVKVNHRLVPLDHVLTSGDQVECITSRTQQVKSEWLQMVGTAKARNKILSILRRQDREYIKKGEDILREFFQTHDLVFSIQAVERISTARGFQTRQELERLVGEGNLVLDERDANVVLRKKAKRPWYRRMPFLKDKAAAPVENLTDDFFQNINTKQVLAIGDDAMAHCEMATCCTPVPGDDAVGFVTPGHPIKIHRRSCPNALKRKSQHGNEIVALRWQTHRQQRFPVNIYIKGVDEDGVLFSIAELFHNRLNAAIRRLTMESNGGIFEGTIEVLVYDTDDIKTIIDALTDMRNIDETYRL